MIPPFMVFLKRIKRHPFPTPRRYSALGAATIYGDIEVMRLLLDAGADVDIRDGWEERTPILRISEFKSTFTGVTGYPELK